MFQTISIWWRYVKSGTFLFLLGSSESQKGQFNYRAGNILFVSISWFIFRPTVSKPLEIDVISGPLQFIRLPSWILLQYCSEIFSSKWSLLPMRFRMLAFAANTKTFEQRNLLIVVHYNRFSLFHCNTSGYHARWTNSLSAKRISPTMPRKGASFYINVGIAKPDQSCHDFLCQNGLYMFHCEIGLSFPNILYEC